MSDLPNVCDISFDDVTMNRIEPVRTVRQAIECLMLHWPISSSVKLITARQTCLDVLDGNKQPDSARMAFMDPAQEAGMLVRRERQRQGIDQAKANGKTPAGRRTGQHMRGLLFSDGEAMHRPDRKAGGV